MSVRAVHLSDPVQVQHDQTIDQGNDDRQPDHSAVPLRKDVGDGGQDRTEDMMIQPVP